MASRVGFTDRTLLGEFGIVWLFMNAGLCCTPSWCSLDLLTKEVENTQLSILGKVNNDHFNNLTTWK